MRPAVTFLLSMMFFLLLELGQLLPPLLHMPITVRNEAEDDSFKPLRSDDLGIDALTLKTLALHVVTCGAGQHEPERCCLHGVRAQ